MQASAPLWAGQTAFWSRLAHHVLSPVEKFDRDEERKALSGYGICQN